jgi:hypothetical protein
VSDETIFALWFSYAEYRFASVAAIAFKVVSDELER